MARSNFLSKAPPYAVERACTTLGHNLRTARLRRNLTIEVVADAIGTGPRAVLDAEHGKVTSSIVNFVALLWYYDMLDTLDQVADPTQDHEGLALLDRRERARQSGELDDDF